MSVSVSDPTRRKVVQYVRTTLASADPACGDGTDTEGHGTHTAGTAVGQAFCSPFTCTAEHGRSHGIAPGAQLAVYDAGPAPDGFLILPADLEATVFEWAYRAGARVHSDSWGADASGQYSDLDFQVDEYSWTHPDLLFVVAAGNNGDEVAAPYVSSPGAAKNAVTVGALYSSADSRSATFCGGSSYATDPDECNQIPSKPAYTRDAFSSYGTPADVGRGSHSRR
jgi:hypothetical protein